MALSFEEKARFAKIYQRNRHWGVYGWPASAFMGVFMSLSVFGRDFLHRLDDSSAGKHVGSLCLLALLIGIFIGAMIVQAIVLTKMRKRDQEELALAERYFPKDCPWLQEESILRQAEQLDRQAKADQIVDAALNPRR